MTNKKVTVFAPASVSNVGPGFDILGFALEGMGDTITLFKTENGRFTIESIGADLPTDPDQNVATVALRSFCEAVGYKDGLHIVIEKNFKPGSGLGSSASSAVGAVFAVNELLAAGYSKEALIPFALDGEALASGNRHADNIAPCMLGGFVVVKGCDPFDGFKIHSPEDLKVLIIFPDVPIKTAEARAMLPTEISMKDGIQQAANMAALIHGLNTNDFEMIKNSLHDQFAQPFRKQLIPLYAEVEALVMGEGAYGFNISGSGPAMFAFFKEEDHLSDLKIRITELYNRNAIQVRFHESGVNIRGVEVM